MRSSKAWAGIEIVDGEVWGRMKLELPGELIAIRKLSRSQYLGMELYIKIRFGGTTIPATEVLYGRVLPLEFLQPISYLIFVVIPP